MTIRNILPRRTLRDRDNTDGRYPTIARTGDRGRTGNFRTAFDDSDTPIFISGSTVTVSYPTSLRTSSPLLSSDLTSSITAPGRVDRGTVEVWQRATKQVGTFVPFKEIGLHEQDSDKSSAYFLTGSDPGDIGFGLQGRLDAKTALRLELPIQHETHFDPHTASVYYYNACGFFEEINAAEKFALQLGWDDIPYNEGDGCNHLDVRFFDALGNYALSGSKYAQNREGYSDGDPSALDDGWDYVAMEQGAAVAMSIREPESVLVNPKFAANATQSIDVGSLITAPFVIERIEIEMPFKAGPGWLRDCTTFGAPDFLVGDAPHIGGPGITVALSNQLAVNRRELIASATLYPEKDLHPWVEIPNVNSSDSLDSFTSELIPTYKLRAVNGASAMGVKPTVVVGNEGDTQYTGSLRFTMEPRISNGITVISNVDILRFSSAGGDPEAWLKTVSYPTNIVGTPLTITPFGRAGFGDASGRSILGRERAVPLPSRIAYQNYLDLKYQPYSSNGLSGSNVAGVNYDKLIRNQQANVYSPYVIMPGDQLILSVSKYRPAWKTRDFAFRRQLMLTASHDASIPPGVVRMTIYGSHLREGKEFHDTSNTPLTSDAVHESINYEPVLDQFRGAPRSLYSGSYLDNIVTGSHTLRNGATMRGVVGRKSILSSTLHTDTRKSVRNLEAYEFGGTNLMFNQMSSPNERYWDTLLPAMTDIFETDGASVYKYEGDSAVNVGYVILDYYPGAFLPPPIEPIYSDNHIGREFPFGPRYSALSRRLEQNKPRVHTVFNGDQSQILPKTPDQLTAANFVVYTSLPEADFKNRGTKPIGDWIVSNTVGEATPIGDYPGFTAPLINDVIKMIFGFGDRNTMSQNGVSTDSVGTSLGTTNQPNLSRSISSVLTTLPLSFWTPDHVLYKPVIRGWKYGVMNGLPQYSKVIFRNDRYGQFRDMLEQRLYGTFYETAGYKSDGTLGGSTGKISGPVSVRFVGRDGTSVDPSRTASSNLNNEATSSLPFFDGELRNRPTIDLARLGVELVAPLII